MMKIKDLCTFASKSTIKAGDATPDGQYMFFTSSEDESKRYNDYLFDGEGIVMGTGGNATLHYYKGKYAVSTDCVVLLPDNRIRTKYLYYYFLSNFSLLEDGFKGAGLKHTNKNYIGNIEIKSIPSLEEQDIVISILDGFSDVIQSRSKEISLLDHLIKARFVEMFGDPVHNTEHLPFLPMTEVCEIIDGDRGKNYPKQEEFYNEEYCLFLNAKNVTNHGFDFSECMFVTKEKDAALRKGKLKRGDVVLTTRGTLGNLAFYTDVVPYENVRINSGMVILRMNRQIIDERFFIEQFRMQVDDIKKRVASGSAQPQLPISTMNKIAVIMPVLKEQKQFASFVAQIDKSKFVVQQALDKAQLLFDSLMQKYFG